MLQKALHNLIGIALLLASLVLAVLAVSVLDRGSGQAIWIFLIGLIAYGASAAVAYLQPSAIQYSTENGEPGKQEGNREPDLELKPDVFPGPEPGPDTISVLESDPASIYESTQIALRRINRLPALSRCDLITLLPRTLFSNHLEPGAEWPQHDQTPLEKARALREVLIAAIDKLRAPAEVTSVGSGADLALGYNILRESYVEDKSVVSICRRHSISQTKYFREQRDAVLAISRHLEANEALLSRSHINS